MPVGFGRGVKSKGRPLSVKAHVKYSIIKVETNTDCLAHALIIGFARLTKDPKYNSYRRVYKIRPVAEQLLRTTGIDLKNGGGVREIQQFQDHFREYKIVVFGELNCEDIILEGQIVSEKRVNLLYDEATSHFHVVANLTGAMSKRFIC